jgi:hypothetical protein
MTDERSRWPSRFRFHAGRLFLAMAVVVITLPFALIWSLAIGLLLAVRPLIVVVLGCAIVGGVAAGTLFVCAGDWPNAAQAGLIASLSGGTLAGHAALADRFGFTGGEAPSMVPPWWWHL